MPLCRYRAWGTATLCSSLFPESMNDKMNGKLKLRLQDMATECMVKLDHYDASIALNQCDVAQMYKFEGEIVNWHLANA